MSTPRIRRPRRRRTRRPVWMKAGMGLGVAAIFFVLVELVLRIAGVQAAYTGASTAGWKMVPDMRAHTVPNHGEPFRITTNDEGLRTELPRARREGVRRVALMGDSTVIGWGVDDGGSVGDGLEAALADPAVQAAFPALGPVEVLNGGQPGYSTFQAAWLFEETVADWQPDLTILFLPQHDGNLVLVSDREIVEGAAGPGATVRVWLATHSRLYNLLRGVLFKQAAEKAALPMNYGDAEPRVPRVSDDDRAEAVRRVRERAATWGGEVAIGLLPHHADLVMPHPPDRPVALWAEAAGPSLDVPVVDVRGCCTAGGGALVLPHDRGHLTAEGNRAVGAALAPPVAELLLR